MKDATLRIVAEMVRSWNEENPNDPVTVEAIARICESSIAQFEDSANDEFDETCLVEEISIELDRGHVQGRG